MTEVFWLGLAALLIAVLALDLGVFHRGTRAQTTGEALLWSIVWIGTALAFNVFVYFAARRRDLGPSLCRASVPAVIAVTRDPFLAFSSNAFAILGLRSLYFVIAPLIGRFRFLKLSLIFVMAFVGVKMLLAHYYPLPTAVSLSFILGILGVGIVASVIGAPRDTVSIISPVEPEIDRLVRVSVRGARRIVVAVVGATVLLAGVAMLILPGPGLLVIPIGLAVLSTEFVWARRWLARLRESAQRNNPFRPKP